MTLSIRSEIVALIVLLLIIAMWQPHWRDMVLKQLFRTYTGAKQSTSNQAA